jgi:hypothetical protein
MRHLGNGHSVTTAEAEDQMGTDAELYIDLLKRILVNNIYQDPAQPAHWYRGTSYDAARRELGKDWPSLAHTMVGSKRLDNVQHCIESVLQERIPGDLIETGVWRGGVGILMRGILKAHHDGQRTVWLADSFRGIPPTGPDGHHLDQALSLDQANDVLGVSRHQVEENFRRYGLLDAQVRFLEGWFSDTLPAAPIRALALLRLDGDLYKSTTDALTHLYPKVSPGGFVIIDDFEIEACRQAVTDYRAAHGIDDDICPIDDNGVFWRKRR